MICRGRFVSDVEQAEEEEWEDEYVSNLGHKLQVDCKGSPFVCSPLCPPVGVYNLLLQLQLLLLLTYVAVGVSG